MSAKSRWENSDLRIACIEDADQVDQRVNDLCRALQGRSDVEAPTPLTHSLRMAREVLHPKEKEVVILAIRQVL